MAFACDTILTLAEELAHDANFATTFAPVGEPPAPAVAPVNDSAGILLLALGHPYYGEMAANLAASIRYTDAHTPIHLVWCGNALAHLDKSKLALFTTMAEAPAESYTKRGKTAYFKAKTWMHDLSPYQRTLFLDVDMLWLTKINVATFMAELRGVPFTIQNRYFIDLATVDASTKPPFYLWADVKELKAAYNFAAGKLYGLHSELVYFEKTPAIAALFASVQSIFENPKCAPRVFAGDMADELAFVLAMLEHDIHPHKTPWSPVYWWKLDGRNGIPHRIQNLAANYVAYSVGGNVQPSVMVNTYNLMSKVFMRNVSPARAWGLKNKKQFIAERQAL